MGKTPDDVNKRCDPERAHEVRSDLKRAVAEPAAPVGENEPPCDEVGPRTETGARVGAATGVGAGVGAGVPPPESRTGGSRDPEEIRAEIERTRLEMTGTLQALRERITPEHLKEQAAEYGEHLKEQAVEYGEHLKDRAQESVRQATVGRVKEMARHMADRMGRTARYYRSEVMRSSAMDTIREHPIPAAMAAIGLGWLITAGRGSVRRRSREWTFGSTYPGDRRPGYGYGQGYGQYERYGQEYGERYSPQYEREYGREYGEEQGRGVTERVSEQARQAGQAAGEYASQMTERAKGYASQAGQAASEMAGRTSEYLGQAKDTASQYLSQAGEAVGGYASQARDAASRYAEQAQEQARRAASGIDRMMHENPMALGVAAMAIGALVGLSLPETRWEDRAMGETRDEFLRRAQETGRETMERAKDVAQQTGQQVMEEVQTQMGQQSEEERGHS